MQKTHFPMLRTLSVLLLCLPAAGAEMRLFDGRTFAGWNGDTNRTWRVQGGALVGGSLKERIPQNEFLCTDRMFTNFVLRLKFKLVGDPASMNAGIQVRSQRTVQPPNEMIGYQADIGEPAYYGCLYDESRRNRILAQADQAKLKEVLRRGDWNDYEIRCEGKRIQLFINGLQTVDYLETDPEIPQFGRIGLQIHSGPPAEVAYRDLVLTELP